MLKIQNIYLSMVALILISSCGWAPAPRNPVNEIATSIHPPAQFPFTNNNCQHPEANLNLGPNNSLGQIKLFELYESEIQEIKVLLNDTRMEKSLISPIVGSTIYNPAYEKFCGQFGSIDFNEGFSRIQCPNNPGFSQTNKGQNLRVCKKDIELKRDSVESAALSSIHKLNQAYEFFQYATKKQLRKIKLEIFPEYSLIFKRLDEFGMEVSSPIRVYYVRNMVYWPGWDTISVFPEDADTYNDARENERQYPYLWESTFVLGHELGHHIQFNIAPKIKYCPAAKWNSLKHQFESVEDKNIKINPPAGINERLAKICSSITEAFADLFSNYHEQGAATSISGLPGFYPTRSPERSAFSDGTPKQLNQTVLTIYLEKADTITTPPNIKIDFRDTHMIGAILAYNINRFFKIIQDANRDFFRDDQNVEDPNDPEDRFTKAYTYRMKWLELFMEYFKDKNPPMLGDEAPYDLYFRPIIEALEYTLNDAIVQARIPVSQLNALKTKICKASKEGLSITLPLYMNTCR